MTLSDEIQIALSVTDRSALTDMHYVTPGTVKPLSAERVNHISDVIVCRM